MDRGTKRDTVKERVERKERGKEKEKARERKARRKEERKARERATAGKEREIGGTSIMIRDGWNRSVVIVVTVGNGVTRRPNALNGRSVVQWSLVQWCHILHRLLFLTLDPLCRKRVQAVNSSPVSPVCWSESRTTISEDSPTSDAPLYSLDVEVLPPPRESCESRPTASARIAPIAMDDERVEKGSRVELAGLVRDVGLNGRKGICMGRAPDGERWLIALPGGKRVNVKCQTSNLPVTWTRKLFREKDTSAVPLRGPEDPPSRRHDRGSQPDSLGQPLRGAKSVSKPEGKVIGTNKSSTTVRFRVCRWISSSSLVLLCGVPRHRPRQLC